MKHTIWQAAIFLFIILPAGAYPHNEEVLLVLAKLPIELKALFYSLLIALLLSVLFAALLCFTGLKGSALYAMAKITLVVSVFMGGCYVSKRYASKGLIHGFSMGVLFFTFLLILSLIVDPNYIDIKTLLTNLALCLVSGGAGGILGIGLSEL